MLSEADKNGIVTSNNCDYIINKEIPIIIVSEDYIVKGNDITSEFDTLKMNIDWTKYDVEEKPVSEDKKK